MNTPIRTVVVIGAGAAGLAAARTLTTSGVKVTILEASERIGGRIHSIMDERFPVHIELGAEFVHGVPPETFKVLDLNKIEALEINGTSLALRNNKISEVDQTDIWNALKLFADSEEHDCSFAEFASRHKFETKKVEAATAFVEGFNAAHADLISARSLAVANEASASIEGERQFRLSKPYLEVAKALFNQADPKFCELRLNAEVKSVDWKRGLVSCTLVSGEKIEGSAAIITLPLPLLKNRSVYFEPALDVKEQSLSRIEMGNVQRVVILFKTRFWQDLSIEGRGLEDLSFITSDRKSFRTWWTLSPQKVPVLVGWNAGAAYIENIKEEDMVNMAVEQLASIFQLETAFIQKQIETTVFHDWANDRLFQGAYSYCKAGGVDAPRILAEPIEDTLYFAGEATNWEGHIGTVHGAIQSGDRAAGEYLKLRNH